ncbi:hypothetical protein MSBR3_1907 [Methanosarcina barkeri 3]|uniref:Uncharacterized protein n=1 Tax=Methanosarcina barkeri 3 TaxID=1434107 RepID=A0A0E3WX08_METBA|nr:hypothetical protein [Methanosarcina barkeri]AKB82485.1 hypothetical protein MSBR3_1907 [Methanosarcina barkeri 3]
MLKPNDFEGLIQFIVTGSLLPILNYLIKSLLSRLFNINYLPTPGKSEYKNFLISNSQPISDLFYKLELYKQDTSMKYFWGIEGGAIGALFSIALSFLFFIISAIKGFNKFTLFEPYYNYCYCVQKDIDLLSIVMSFNLFSLIAITIIALFLYLLYSKGYNEPKLTEELSLKRWSKYIYYIHWFSMGILIGTNGVVLYLTLWFHDIFIRFIGQSTIGLINYVMSIVIICIYLINFMTSIIFVIYLHNATNLFSRLFKQKINNFYIDDLPRVRIKTDGGDASGKINDIQNESLIILNDGSVLKAIRWDQIKIMELEKTDVNNKMIMKFLPQTTENNKSWWKFW